MRDYTEQDMKRILSRETEISDQVNERLESVYSQIRANAVPKKPGRNRGRRTWYFGGVAAAAAACIVSVSNPVIAAKLPIVGNIFSQIADKAPFHGDYSKVATPLEAESTAEGTEKRSTAYTQTSDGLTMTLSEVYCSPEALYVTTELKAEEAFPDTFIDQFGNQTLQLLGTAQYSYNPEEQLVMTYLSGRFTDANTYLGMFRINLDETRIDYTRYDEALAGLSEEELERTSDAQDPYRDLIQTVELPDSFHVRFSISQIVGDKAEIPTIYEVAGVAAPSDEALDAMSEEEWSAHMQKLEELVPDYDNHPSQYRNYWYDGPFTFDLDLTVDREHLVSVPVDDDSDSYHISSVTKTPFELTVHEEHQEDPFYQEDNCILLALDADGRQLQWSDASVSDLNEYQVDGRNLSKVDLYLISWEQYESLGIKGNDVYYSKPTDENGTSIKALLEEHARYHREVVFDSKA